MTKKARKGLSVAAAASLAAGMLVGAVAPASAAGVSNLAYAKGLAIDTDYAFALDTEGPALITWGGTGSETWTIVDFPDNSILDQYDFRTSINGDGTSSIYLDSNIGAKDNQGNDVAGAYGGHNADYNPYDQAAATASWTNGGYTDYETDRSYDSYPCEAELVDLDSGAGTDFTTVYGDTCFQNRDDEQMFDIAGEYKFEVKQGSSVSLVTLVVGNLNVVRVELAVDRNVVADNGDVTFTIKSYDDAGRLTYGYNYDSSDELYEFVEEYSWDFDSNDYGNADIDYDAFSGDEYFDFSNGALTIVFDINDDTDMSGADPDDYVVNKNYTFEAEVDGIQSNVVTVRIGETYDADGYEVIAATEVAGKVVQVSDPDDGLDAAYVAIHKSQRPVTYVFDSGSADNAGKYVYLDIVDDGAESITSVPESGTWNKLDSDGKLNITVTVGENVIDSEDAYTVGVYDYDFTNDTNDLGSDYADTYAQYFGSGETTAVELVNNTEYVDYYANDYQWMDADYAPFYNPDDEAYDEYYKSVLPGQSVDIKVKVTDVFGTVLPSHPVYLDYYDGEYNAFPSAWSGINWSEDADYAEFADEVETDANGIATFTVKNTETSAMTQIELWNGFSVFAYGNDSTYLGSDWIDGFEVYFQTVRSLDVDDLNVNVGGQEDIQNNIEWDIEDWNDAEKTIYIDDADGTDASYHFDSVTMTYGIVNSDEVLLWGVPVTITATGGFVSEDDEHDVSDMTANTMTFVSWGVEYDWENGKPVTGEANFTTQKAGATSFTLAAGGKSVTATQTYEVAGEWVARYIAPVESTVSVSAGDITKLSYKVTDRFGNVVPGVGVGFFYGAATDPVLGSIPSSMSASGTSNDSGLVAVDVWTAATVLDQRVSAVTATITTESAATVECAADEVWLDSESAEYVEALAHLTSLYNDGDLTLSEYNAAVAALESCTELEDGSTVSAANKSAVAAISYVVPAVSANVKALKNAFSVSVDNAKGKVVRVFVGSTLKGMFVAKTNEAVRRYKATAGSKVVTVKVEDYSRAKTIKVRK